MDPDLVVFRRELAGRSVTEREEYYDRRNLSPEDRDRIEASLSIGSDHPFGRPVWSDPAAGETTETPTTGSIPQANTLGRYQLIRLLGRGGMGEVYLARDPVLDRDVALKVLSVEYDDIEARKRIVREARAASRLRHPNIVTVFDAGEDNGRSYIAMEYVSGDTLGDLIRRRAPLATARKLELVEGACAGLAHAHKIFVVHLDIKPDNLMLDETGIVRVLDFGIARVLRADVEVTRSVAGTLRYMSPEQLQGREIDRRTDVYSLGCSLFELVSGVPAFSGSTHEVVTRISSGPIPRLIEIDSAIDPRLDALVSQAMALNPKDRHQNMDDLRADLARLRDQLTASDSLAQPMTSPSAPVSAPVTAGVSTARSFKRLAVWTGVCALAGLIGGLGFWTFSRKPVPPAAASPDPAIIAAGPTLVAAAPGPVVPTPAVKPANDGDEVWRLLASGDREGVIRRLRALGATSAKSKLAAEVVEAVRGSVLRNRLSANDRSATETATYRLGEERLAQADLLTKSDRLSEALHAFWEAGDHYRQSVRTNPSSAEVPSPRQIPVSPAQPLPGPPSRPLPPSTVQTASAEPTTPGPVVAEPKSVGGTQPDTAIASTSSDQLAILEVLRRYERAYRALDLAAVQQVYPVLTRNQADDLRRSFAGMTAYEIEIRNPRVNLENDTARVRALIARRLVPKVGRPVESEDPSEFELRRERDAWVIIKVTSQ